MHPSGGGCIVAGMSNTTTTTFAPTAEQVKAIEAAATGAPLVIEAGAGTGKTSTLKLIAEKLAPKRGAYLAFNKAIASEAAEKFPETVACSTVHSLAYRAVGYRFRDRLSGKFLKPDEVARILEARQILLTDHEGGTITIPPGKVARIAMAAVEKFCQTADTEIGTQHVSRVPSVEPKDQWALNREIARIVVPIARRAWEDLQEVDGRLKFGHSHYLKMWQLSHPRIDTDYILFDEAQDANPLMLDVVMRQGHAQLIFVGDSQQQIYGWNGAINAMAKARDLPGANVVFLTKSFRFGPEVAHVANTILAELAAELRIEGAGGPSAVTPVLDPDVVLCRTNAATIDHAVRFLDDGLKVCISGNVIVEVERFAKAALQLERFGNTSHEALSSFSSWKEVSDWATEDPDGAAEILLLVRLIDSRGAQWLLDLLKRCVDEPQADVVLTTAHRSKGCEWDRVMIDGGFHWFDPDAEDPKDPSPEELRLLYVAVTRAQVELDISALPTLVEDVSDEEE